MYNPFKISKYLREQRTQIVALKQVIEKQRAELHAKEMMIETLKHEIDRLKNLSDQPHAFHQDEKIGSVRILEVKTKKGLDMEKTGAICVMVGAAIGLLRSKLFDVPFTVPQLPQTDIYHYRIYDERVKQERVIGEKEFKALVKENVENYGH